MSGPDPDRFDVVVPTIGRPSLDELLASLAADVRAGGTPPGRVFLCDDRPPQASLRSPWSAPLPAELADQVRVVTSGGHGPAAARNAGWRRSTATWIAFLDDDVRVPAGWLAALAADLTELPVDVAASQGRIEVPAPAARRATDWERNVAALEIARWATADMAYRREALQRVGGFDERFPRAYREDADLGLRVTGAGYRIARGQRHVVHPVRPADDAVSIRLQAGNADDPLMRVLHGPGWRERAGVPRGRRPWHLAAVVSATVAAGATVTRRRRAAVVAGAAWLALTADLAVRRIVPGPRTTDEVSRMLRTSLVLPFAATSHWLRGWATLRRRLAQPGPVPDVQDDHRGRAPVITRGAAAAGRPAAVLFDRDGTLVHDVPYNGDPSRVAPVPDAAEVLTRLRDEGVPTAVISNQSGIGRGYLTRDQVDAVNVRLEALIGPLGPVLVCPHGPDDGCACRKPAPGLIVAAAEALGVDPTECVVIGDIGADVQAAAAVGARGILVPTPITRAEEVAAAGEVAPDLRTAVDRALAAPAVPERDR